MVQHGETRRIAPEDLEQTIHRLSGITSGTPDLFTLYIPPERTIADVRENLDRESGRQNPGRDVPVIPAIEEARGLLRKFGQIPENGLAIFCGPGGTGCEALEPPAGVRDFLLRLSTRFETGPLVRMRAGADALGLILLDLDRAYWAISRGGEPGQSGSIGSNVPAKHHKGGQSAARFQRLRKIAAHEFYTRVGEHAGAGLLAGTGNGERLAGVLIGGQAAAAAEFAAGTFLPSAIRQKILGTIVMAEISQDSLRVLAKKGADLIRERNAAADLRLLDAFLEERVRDRGYAVTGEPGVRERLAEGTVRTLFLSSSLKTSGAVISCSLCGHTAERTIRLGPEETVPDILAHTCRACNGPLIADAAVDRAEELGRLAIGSGAQIVIVPEDSEAGKRFFRESDGVGALLRFLPER